MESLTAFRIYYGSMDSYAGVSLKDSIIGCGQNPPFTVNRSPFLYYKIITQENYKYRNFEHSPRAFTYNITKNIYKRVFRLTLNRLCIIFILT